MKLLIFIILFFVSPLLGQTAPDPDTAWFIYTYTDVETMADVMKFLSFVDSDGSYQNMIFLAISFGLFMSAFIKKFFDPAAIGIQLITVIGLMAFLFGTRTDVHIVNVKTYYSLQTTSNYEKVSNVPFAFAFTASVYSTLGYVSAKLVNTGLAFVSGDKFQEISFLRTGAAGGGDIYNIMQKVKLREFGEKGQLFQNYFGSYMQKCIYGKAVAYDSQTLNVIKSSTYLIADVAPDVIKDKVGVDISRDLVSFYSGRITCQQAYVETVNAFTTFYASNEMTRFYVDRFDGEFSNIMNVLRATTKIYAQADGDDATTNVKDFATSMGMINQANVAYASYIGGGSASSSSLYGGFGAGLANSSMIESGVVKSSFAAKQLPYLMAVLNTIMYILFPFVFLIAIASAQLKILKSFFLALLWPQLWPVTFEAVGFFINKDMINGATEAIVNAGAVAHTTTNMINMDIVVQLNESIAYQSAMAANLLWSVPVISGFILSGSWHSLLSMTSALGQATTNASNHDFQMQKKAELAQEQRMHDETNRNWSPTIGEMARMNMGHQQTNSSKVLAEVNALNGMGGVAALAGRKGGFDAVKNLSEYSSLTAGDMSASGHRSAFEVQTANTTLEKTLELGGGRESTIERMSDAGSWDNFKNTSEGSTAMSEFKKFHSEAGDGRTERSFYDDITTQQSRENLQKDFGAAGTTSNVSDGELRNMGAGSKMDSNIKDNASYENYMEHGKEALIDVQTTKMDSTVGETAGLKTSAASQGMSVEEFGKASAQANNTIATSSGAKSFSVDNKGNEVRSHTETGTSSKADDSHGSISGTFKDVKSYTKNDYSQIDNYSNIKDYSSGNLGTSSFMAYKSFNELYPTATRDEILKKMEFADAGADGLKNLQNTASTTINGVLSWGEDVLYKKDQLLNEIEKSLN